LLIFPRSCNLHELKIIHTLVTLSQSQSKSHPQMNIYIFNGVAIVWILSEIYLNRFLRSAKQDKHADKNTELFLWITIGLATFAGVFLSRAWALPVFADEDLAYVGIAMMVLGILIRFSAIKQLGKYFTVDVAVRQDHQLMQMGFYKYLRHPSYAGSLISFLGFGIALNNWISVAAVFIPVLIAFILRMNVEEKVLTEQFGKPYTDYMSQTKRVLPFVY